jgi:hypothetical protein
VFGNLDIEPNTSVGAKSPERFSKSADGGNTGWAEVISN